MQNFFPRYDQVEAIMATLSASATGTRQIIYTGTPPYPGCPGTVFRRRRTACTTDAGKHDAWHEWSVDGDTVAEINAGDRTLWYLTNPAMGLRLSEDFTAEEYKTMSVDGFARERLGWWSPILTEKTDYALDSAAWTRCASEEPKPEGRTAFGVKFSADGSTVCLCGAVIPKDGTARISLLEQKPAAFGLSWLAEFLNARYDSASCVVIDGRNGVDVLIERIRPIWRAHDSVVKPTARDMVAAVSGLTDDIAEGALTWYKPQTALDESARNAVKRPIGGGYGFGGDNSLPIEACALALWGAKNSKRDPKRKMRIG